MKHPVCVPCGLTMMPEECGVVVTEYRDKEKKEPYKVWMADKYYCPQCGTVILWGFGNNPISGDWDGEKMVKDKESSVVDFY